MQILQANGMKPAFIQCNHNKTIELRDKFSIIPFKNRSALSFKLICINTILVMEMFVRCVNGMFNRVRAFNKNAYGRVNYWFN